jgi:tetratricopeptide (TPR) repeat protein
MRRLLLGLTVLLAACQQPIESQAPPARSVSLAEQLRGEGDALMAKGNHAGAVEKYRHAVDLEPGSVPLHFALGTAYSFLDKRPDAVAQFRWVIDNGAAESAEYQDARRWLVRVGAWVEPAAGGRAEAASGEPSASAAAAGKKGDPAGTGSVSGTTQWPGLSPAQQPARVELVLMGEDEVTQTVKRRAGVALGDAYEFRDVPAGQYRLYGVVGEETILWDQKIAVQPGKPTELALTKSASRVPGHEFPEARRPQPE